MLSTTEKVTGKSIHVNTLCENVHKERAVLLGTIVSDMVLSHQEERLTGDVGPRFGRDKVVASFHCPGCSGRHFIRKGKRYRLYASVLGKIRLPIAQVQCALCGYRFCPYKEQIGLAFIDRISPTLKQRQMNLTCQISYQKARAFIESCLGVGPSGPTIRKEIDRRAKEIQQIPVTAKNQIVYHDSTKVKAGSKDRGVSIHLAVTSKPDTERRRKKRLLFLRTGSASQIKKSLTALKAKGIVHDGDMDLSGCVQLLQRCLWHLVHQLKHFLWQDGLPIEARAPYVKELITILHRTPNVKVMKKKYRSFIEKLRTHDLLQSFVHLQNAEPEMATFREHGIFGFTTSPVEREMREINRRVDIGVRWSVPGVENLLLVKMHMAMNEPQR
jgi:predicted metal-binding protein